MTAGENPYQEGKVLLVDKPLNWTSFQAVKKIHYLLGKIKVGHAGTLDPLATGLLIVCTGKFTKRIQEFMAQEKEYTGKAFLGATTPSYDLETAPQDFRDISSLTDASVQQTARQFVGEISQIPPAHSAVRKNGQRAYALARKGKEVKLEPRRISIRTFELGPLEGNEISFRVVCSTGTYIRSLVHDLGQVLGTGAYLSNLRRTRIGEFRVEDAWGMEEIAEQLKDARQPQKG